VSEPVPQPGLFATDAFPTEVLLIRHGRSADVIPGAPDSFDPPLHETGVLQATALAERLDAKQLDGVYSSDLARAVETAAPLARPRGLRVIERADLREVHLGDWEGGEFRRRAAMHDPEFLRFAEAGRWDAIPGAERDEDLRARTLGAVREVAAKHAGGSVAVVCHGGVINAVLAELLRIERSTFTVVENTSITVLRFAPDERAVVITMNDTHHLYDPVVGFDGAAR
jgi:2,3-bisphosphoglycerate-dependent phosphoglycerate mutase